jgi:hypothetical protein
MVIEIQMQNPWKPLLIKKMLTYEIREIYARIKLKSAIIYLQVIQIRIPLSILTCEMLHKLAPGR